MENAQFSQYSRRAPQFPTSVMCTNCKTKSGTYNEKNVLLWVRNTYGYTDVSSSPWWSSLGGTATTNNMRKGPEGPSGVNFNYLAVPVICAAIYYLLYVNHICRQKGTQRKKT